MEKKKTFRKKKNAKGDLKGLHLQGLLQSQELHKSMA